MAVELLSDVVVTVQPVQLGARRSRSVSVVALVKLREATSSPQHVLEVLLLVPIATSSIRCRRDCDPVTLVHHVVEVAAE